MNTHHDSGSTYRQGIADALADGWRFASLHATTEDGGRVVRTLLSSTGGDLRIESANAAPDSVPTIVDLCPAAGWDEREAHDLYGVDFDGHEPLRPLVDHDVTLEQFATPVRGHDAYQVAVGPIHAGVIESGHFRFHVVGELILHVDTRLFYKHRGLERAADGLALEDALGVVARSCSGCWASNAVAYAHACEEALGLPAPPELARARTILLELERVWNTLNDISAICAGVGLAAGTSRFAALVDDARRLNQRLTGHRFLAGSVAVGGNALDLDGSAIRDARKTLARIRSESSRAWKALLFNGSFMDRMPDIGIVDAATASTLGAVGTAARAAGLAEDLRTTSPRLAYDGFAVAVLRRQTGDVQARLEQRALELLPCLDILDRLLDGSIRPVTSVRAGQGASIGVGRVESPRGATTCVVERDGDRVSRVRLRTGSYANWPAVAHAAAGNLLPDFPLINKSFELCYACVDR
ncbi:NADH-quinone oxidoreductase subunit C [Gaiella sp.]|uniref:hydrogenase large subunit n=1 Tax=Gaiella sp. TaxID=2663207 RepID=UPI003982E545